MSVCPVSAVRNRHSERLQRHRRVLLQLWRSGVHSQFPWAGLSVLAGPVPSEGPGENPWARLFQVWGCLHPSAHSPFLSMAAPHFHHCVSVSRVTSLSLPSCEDACDDV